VQATVGINIINLYKVFGTQPQKMMPLIESGISKIELRDKYQHILGLRNINLSIQPGAIQVIMGLSGSGKSTLVRHINRLIEPTAGEIWVNGQDITRLNRWALRRFTREQTAMVFQKFALFPHMTVIENVEFGLRVRGVSYKKRRTSAQQWISRVGLKGYEDTFPNQLSGGMQQRVGLARAMTNDAPILLMDEAFSALDPLIRSDMQAVLLDLQQELAKTIVFITHDLDEALRLGDRVAILRDGEIVQQGAPQEILLKPADEYVASFVRDVNRGRVIRCRTLVVAGPTVDGPELDANLTLEEAARQLGASGYEQANVISKKGRHLGSLTIGQILSAMVEPSKADLS
jgi:glycine betaine/proline transport system ATP-binding protein